MGDEPGIHGDAQYIGLGVDLPLTVRSFGASGNGDGKLIIGGEGVKVYDGYPGHKVAVVHYVETTDPAHWQEHDLGEHRMVLDRLSVPLELGSLGPSPNTLIYLSVRVRVDTEVPPGLYDDFLIVRLELASRTHYASFGFHR